MEGQLRANIYEDVDELKRQVIELQANMVTLIEENDINRIKELPEGQDLFLLSKGKYLLNNVNIAPTIKNKPEPDNVSTAIIEVEETGGSGQLMLTYTICNKANSKVYRTFYYFDSWGKWREITLNDSGWMKLPLATGIVAFNENTIPRYRKINNMLFITGVIKSIDKANRLLGTLPTGFIPSFRQDFFAGSFTYDLKATFFNCFVNPDGTINSITHSANVYDDRTFLRMNTCILLD